MASMFFDGNMRRMTPSAEWRCAAASVAPGRTVKFTVRCRDRAVEGFVVNADGEHHAYVNRCPHVGTPLDLWPNDFLADDGRTLVCSTHGALFEPLTGACVAGPCAGDALTRLPLRRDGDALVIGCP
jgi:nitrite reductase/ring-hydroxylating ferredoxin subunit